MKTFPKAFYFPLLFLMFFTVNIYAADYSCSGENVLNIHTATADQNMTYSENSTGKNKARYFKFQTNVSGEITISFGQNGTLDKKKHNFQIGTTCGGSDIRNTKKVKSDSHTFNVTAGTTYFVKIKEKNGSNILRFTIDFEFKTVLRVGFEQDIYNILEDVSITEGLSSPMPIKIILSYPAAFDISVTYSTYDDTALDGSDYTGITNTIVIPAGETEKIIYVDIFHDSAIELDEQFFISLSNLNPADGSVSYGITPAKIIILEQVDFPVCYEDNFESSLDADWRTLRSVGGYIPKVVNGRLRLTDDSRNLATAVTKDYEFASKENIIIAEFEQFAYGGCNGGGVGTDGADGIVLVLYDSAIGASPIPGGSGGSIGYAQYVGNTPGFEGGWLGLAIDEYGNFANCNEERVGGLPGTSCDWGSGFNPQSYRNYASIRGDGSGMSGYEFLAASSQLSPKVAIKNTTTASPAHKYRFTTDARDIDHLYISLERDINDGNGYQFIINKFDAKDAQYNQTTTPDFIRFAFTSGTGGGCNNHEIDELRVYGSCRAYNPSPPSVASQADIVNDFANPDVYNNGTKYIKTKVAAKTEEITGVYLNDAGDSEIYTTVDSDLKFRIIPYLSDSNCTTREIIRDINGNPAVIAVSSGEAASNIDVVMPAKATQDSRFLITALDFNKVYVESGKSCILNSSTTGNLQGLGQCINSASQYEWAFGAEAHDRCYVNNGAPCRSNNGGASCGHEQIGGLTAAEIAACGYNPDYDDPYGCLMCTMDVNATCSSDNFAIRPDIFSLSTTNPDFPDLLRSGDNYSLTVFAYDDGISSGADGTDDYNITDADNNLTITQTLLFKDGTIPAVGVLHGTSSFNGDFNMTNGVSTNSGMNEVVVISFDDVGRVILGIEDREWAAVDINDVKSVNDATTQDCNGAYVCGNINTTFIPHHFSFVDLNITNNTKNGRFTYIANLDPANSTTFNMSARVETTIESRNSSEGVTQNFTSGANFYENPVNVDVNVTTASAVDANSTRVINRLLSFTNGRRLVSWNEANITKVLRFNFPRAVDNAVNPFVVTGADLNVTMSSTYDAGGSTAIINDDNITGIGTADRNATMLYGRTHASKQMFVDPIDDPYTTNIYYEAYCFLVDSNNTTCNKTLLPNGVASINTNDLRWWINGFHNHAVDGNITNNAVTEKGVNNFVTENARNLNNASVARVDLDYNSTTAGFPYITIMENNASSWLIENENNATAITNEFDVEFYNDGGVWSGEHETSTVTTDANVSRTNRRSMW